MSDVIEDLEWQERALCAQTDPESFFPEKGGSVREAKRVCMSCEVRAECLQYALDHDERFGIWGGLSERERRRVQKGGAIEKSSADERDERNRQIHAEWLAGWTHAELADWYDLGENQIRTILAAHPRTEPGPSEDEPTPTVTPPGDLTARQAEVLQLRQEGLSNPQISERLHISLTTLSGHLTAIRKAGHDLEHRRPTATQVRQKTTWDDCGTPAALARHKHQKVTTCEACLEANRVISREARARKRAAA